MGRGSVSANIDWRVYFSRFGFYLRDEYQPTGDGGGIDGRRIESFSDEEKDIGPE